MSETPPPPQKLDPKLKFALELGPLVLFFLAFWKFGIYVATGVMMVSVLVTLGVSRWKLKRIPIMPLVTGVIVLVFGSLGLIFHNETLIKIKPTALYTLFSAALFFGIVTKRPILRILLGDTLSVTEEGWRILSWRWAFFFLFLAILNEAVWRTQTTETWVTFKSFGFLPLSVVFALAQAPVVLKYEAKEESAEEEAI